MWGRSLSWGDPLQKEVATHSSVLPGKILWTEESGGLQSLQRVRYDLVNKQQQNLPLILNTWQIPSAFTRTECFHYTIWGRLNIQNNTTLLWSCAFL